MYEIYCQLRDQRGVKDSDVVKDTGITKSTFSDWKNGRSKPKNEKLQKIADYFGVTVDYLTTGTAGNNSSSPNFKLNNTLPKEVSYDDTKQLLARNGKNLTTEQRIELIRLLSEIDK